MKSREKFKNILKSDRAPNGARKRRLTLFAVTGNNRFVPIKTLLSFPRQILLVIDIDKTILLLIAVEPTQQIDK